MSKTETLIADSFVKETEKSWVVRYEPCANNLVLPKSTCIWHGGLQFEIPVWLFKKAEQSRANAIEQQRVDALLVA